MLPSDETLKATAKAVEESAKTTAKIVEAGERFGSFIAEYIGGSLEEGMGIFHDKLKYMRWERQIRLMQRANYFLKELGISRPDKNLRLKYAIPLIQAATIEDDDFIQDLWAKLLVNGAVESRHVELSRHYISILEEFSHMDAVIFSAIYKEPHHFGYLYTGLLPVQSVPGYPNQDTKYKPPTKEVVLSLSNLSRLGCIAPGATMGAGPSYTFIHDTELGSELYNACSIGTPVA